MSGWAVPSTNRRYKDTAEWCQRHMTKLEDDAGEEQRKCDAFNAWVPRANGFFTSVIRLEAMQEMLGVKDPAAMASALTQGLRDAQAVGERAQIAHEGGKGETLDVPAVDDTLTAVGVGCRVTTTEPSPLALTKTGVPRATFINRCRDSRPAAENR